MIDPHVETICNGPSGWHPASRERRFRQVYDIPNIDLDLKVVRTNLPPRTIMRGPGFMDAAMVAEQVLEHVVDSLGLDPEETRSRNFLRAPAQMAVPGPQKAGFTFSGALCDSRQRALQPFRRLWDSSLITQWEENVLPDPRGWFEEEEELK